LPFFGFYCIIIPNVCSWRLIVGECAMTDKTTNPVSLSGNTLKIIAAVCMLIDHIGHILLPEYIILRIIGRVSMPIFAYMVAEGCYYTKDRKKYFLTVFLLALVCQTVDYIYSGSLRLGILVTFSLSIALVYSLQYMKEQVFSDESSSVEKCQSIAIFLSVVAAVYVLTRFVSVDYGFHGCMLPVYAEALRQNRVNKSSLLEKVDMPSYRVLAFAAGLLILSVNSSGIQIYSLCSVLLLMLYSGKRGKKKMKWFFYIFYPTHLLVLEAIRFFFIR